jgi:hypothetical protein
LALAVQNRLRFAVKNLGWKRAAQFVPNYILEDLAGLGGAVFRRNWRAAWAYLRGWGRFLASLPGVSAARKEVQRRRVVGDDVIFSVTQIPPSQMEGDVPLLTVDRIEQFYSRIINDLSSLETPTQS